MTAISEQIQTTDFFFENFSKFEETLNLSHKSGLNDTLPPLITGEPLYRGQSNPLWRLETTLDRKIRDFPVSDYYDKIFQAYFEVSSFSGEKWSRPDIKVIRDQCTRPLNSSGIPHILPDYEYLTYLRHYGFPSPLLDWSRSPYVAAFFAYSPLTSEQANVAIYIVENISEENASPVQESLDSICFLQVERHMIADRRHFLQQSEYTICLQYRSGQWRFSNHEDFFKNPRSRNICFRRCLLPACERIDVLKRLDKMNINSITLFNSIESLMQTASNRLFEFT